MIRTEEVYLRYEVLLHDVTEQFIINIQTVAPAAVKKFVVRNKTQVALI